MTVYNILIDYTTGDSFNSERVKEPLDIVVTDILKAKENLKRIKKHYLSYSECYNYGEAYSLSLLTDEGERDIYPFWIGYFETLHGAEIVTEEPDMSFKL